MNLEMIPGQCLDQADFVCVPLGGFGEVSESHAVLVREHRQSRRVSPRACPHAPSLGPVLLLHAKAGCVAKIVSVVSAATGRLRRHIRSIGGSSIFLNRIRLRRFAWSQTAGSGRACQTGAQARHFYKQYAVNLTLCSNFFQACCAKPPSVNRIGPTASEETKSQCHEANYCSSPTYSVSPASS